MKEIRTLEREHSEHMELAQKERIYYESNAQLARAYPNQVHMVTVDQTKSHFLPHIYRTPHVSEQNVNDRVEAQFCLCRC